jgi:hypothetical protein
MPFTHDTVWTIQVLGSAESEDYRLPTAPIVLPAWHLRAPCTLETRIDADNDNETLQLSVADGHGFQVAPRVLTINDRQDAARPPAPPATEGSECGTGVTAAALLLAMGLMGLRRARRN